VGTAFAVVGIIIIICCCSLLVFVVAVDVDSSDFGSRFLFEQTGCRSAARLPTRGSRRAETCSVRCSCLSVVVVVVVVVCCCFVECATCHPRLVKWRQIVHDRGC